jgi:hypothetical protein
MRRALQTWIAIFAIAFNALWPLAANALPKPAALPTGHEICTAFGITVLPASESAPEPDRTAKPQSHCTFCFFAVGADPVVALPHIRINGLLIEAAPTFDDPLASPTAPVFSPAHPRGPPA